MAGRRSPVTEIREILRRLQLGERARRIARDLAVSPNTVAHYRRWASTRGLLTGPLPEPAALARFGGPPRPALVAQPGHGGPLCVPQSSPGRLSYFRIGVSCFLVLATSADAECAWVWWTDCGHKFRLGYDGR